MPANMGPSDARTNAKTSCLFLPGSIRYTKQLNLLFPLRQTEHEWDFFGITSCSCLRDLSDTNWNVGQGPLYRHACDNCSESPRPACPAAERPNFPIPYAWSSSFPHPIPEGGIRRADPSRARARVPIAIELAASAMQEGRESGTRFFPDLRMHNAERPISLGRWNTQRPNSQALRDMQRLRRVRVAIGSIYN